MITLWDVYDISIAISMGLLLGFLWDVYDISIIWNFYGIPIGFR